MNQKALIELSGECGYFLPADFTSRILRLMPEHDDYEYHLLETILYRAKGMSVKDIKQELKIFGEMKYMEVRP